MAHLVFNIFCGLFACLGSFLVSVPCAIYRCVRLLTCPTPRTISPTQFGYDSGVIGSVLGMAKFKNDFPTSQLANLNGPSNSLVDAIQSPDWPACLHHRPQVPSYRSCKGSILSIAHRSPSNWLYCIDPVNSAGGCFFGSPFCLFGSSLCLTLTRSRFVCICAYRRNGCRMEWWQSGEKENYSARMSGGYLLKLICIFRWRYCSLFYLDWCLWMVST